MRECYDNKTIQKLFEPWQGGNLTFRNRFVRAATYLGECSFGSGAMTPRALSRQVETAAGGAGVVISEFGYVTEAGKAVGNQWSLSEERSVCEIKKLAEEIHKAGSMLVVQGCHAGAGYVCDERYCTEMTCSSIDSSVSAFASAALRAKNGGADGFEIHGAHGFLITQFLSPIQNRRTDNYGGTAEKRRAFARYVVKATRDAVGADFPLWMKLSITEGIDGGYDAAYGIDTALDLLECGLDAIEVSSGTSYSRPEHMPSVVGVSAGESEAPFANYAGEIRRQAAPEKLVILTGGLRSLPVIASLFEDRIADMFAMSRPFIAEPDLINRWAEDDARPAACYSCNACLKNSTQPVDCPIMREKQEGDWDPL